MRCTFLRLNVPSAVVRWTLLLAGVAVVSLAGRLTYANDPKLPDPTEMQRLRALYNSIQWQEGPCTATLGNVAEIKVPKGCHFTGADGAAKWAELTHNPPNPLRVGVLRPSDNQEDLEWSIIFSYEDSGHVADDEKRNLDANAILASIREGTDEANNYRRSKGWDPIEIIGWKTLPAYDEETHHLVWALRSQGRGGEGINYNTRILGRTGVMSANLVVGAEDFDAAVPVAKKLLADYRFVSGQKYSEWRSGDKIAQYGLTGLITGGLVVAAAKTGLLAKLGVLLAKFAKVIIVGVLALGAGIAKLFRSIFGGGNARSKT